MPKRVSELESSSDGHLSFLMAQLLAFLKKNSEFAYTLKELHNHFLELDKQGDEKYQKNPKVLYHLIYGYLRVFGLKKLIVHKGNYYYYKKE